MPAILPSEGQDVWLRNGTETADLKRLLIPFHASAMKSYPVSQQVNRAQAEEAQLVDPIDLSQEVRNWTLF
jgi:putative SOS response-associated peptidase YedK